MADNHGQQIEELNDRLREASAEIERTTTAAIAAIDHANVQRMTAEARLDAFAADVLGLANRWGSATAWDGSEALVDRAFGQTLRLVHDRHVPDSPKQTRDFDRLMLLRELAEDDTLLNCACGHGLDEHNGLGCYARLSYHPVTPCECKETDNRTDLDLLRANLLARAEKRQP